MLLEVVLPSYQNLRLVKKKKRANINDVVAVVVATSLLQENVTAVEEQGPHSTEINAVTTTTTTFLQNAVTVHNKILPLLRNKNLPILMK